jgi:hypothetical protein
MSDSASTTRLEDVEAISKPSGRFDRIAVQEMKNRELAAVTRNSRHYARRDIRRPIRSTNLIRLAVERSSAALWMRRQRS